MQSLICIWKFPSTVSDCHIPSPGKTTFKTDKIMEPVLPGHGVFLPHMNVLGSNECTQMSVLEFVSSLNHSNYLV